MFKHDFETARPFYISIEIQQFHIIFFIGYNTILKIAITVKIMANFQLQLRVIVINQLQLKV